MEDFRPIQAFAICSPPGSPNSVRRLRLTDVATGRIEGIIAAQLSRYVDASLTKVAFDPTYHTEDTSVLWIEGFNLPDHVREAIANPREIPPFARGDEGLRVKALFYLGANGSVFFQCWRNFEVFDREKVWLLLTSDTFDVEPTNEPSLVISRRIDSVFTEGNLFFRSYANASTMLNLLDYVTEATETDIEGFVDLPIFRGDVRKLAERCSSLHRKQIRSLVQGNKLKDKRFADLYDRAASVNYDIPHEGDKILIPDTSKGLTELLGFLNDRIYLGPVTGSEMYANSARLRSQG